MTDTTFIDQTTVVTADWLNQVNQSVYYGLNILIAAGGTGTAYTAQLSAAPSRATVGSPLLFTVPVANTGAVTLTLTNAPSPWNTPIAITQNGVALPAGALPINATVMLRYSAAGTWEMTSAAYAAALSVGTLTAATANVTGTLTATTANVTGTLTATTANVTGTLTTTGTITGAIATTSAEAVMLGQLGNGTVQINSLDGIFLTSNQGSAYLYTDTAGAGAANDFVIRVGAAGSYQYVSVSPTGALNVPSTVTAAPATAATHLVQKAQALVGASMAVVTSSRVSGTIYTNNSTRPMFIAISVGGTGTTVTGFIGGTQVAESQNSGGGVSFIFFIALPGQTYSATFAGTLGTWTEWS